MNYFAAISRRADELNQLGEKYLQKLPFMSNHKICKRLWAIAAKIDKSTETNPDWVDSTLDHSIPFASPPRNGSLYFSLGFAITAQDAKLRNLLEVAEGRDSELNLAVLAEKDIVESYVTPACLP